LATTAIAFGLIAALSWGIHDILVRYVSHTVGILQSLLLVLFFGIIAQIGLLIFSGDYTLVDEHAVWWSIGAGVTFCIACIGHYNAFARGPVRLVAPLIGCFSVLSFLFAALSGTAISLLQWLVIFALVAGIGLVARSSEGVETSDDSLAGTIGYCLMAMFGFAITFALGQEASAASNHIITSLITRCVTIFLVGLIFLKVVKQQKSSIFSLSMKSLSILALMGFLDALALDVVLAAGTLERPEFASAASSIFGLVTVLLAWIFLKEAINKIQWLGILIIFSSIAYLAIS